MNTDQEQINTPPPTTETSQVGTLEMRGPPEGGHNAFRSQMHPHVIPFLVVSCGLFLVLVTLGVVRVVTAEERVCHTTQSSDTTKNYSSPKDMGKNPEASSEAKILGDKNPKQDATPSANTKAVIKFPLDTPPYTVNIRQKPATNSATVALAKYGDTFEIISNDESWYQIKLASGSGYIRAEYVERSK